MSLQSHLFTLTINCTQAHSTCSPQRPYDALHLGCVSCASIRNAYLWRATQRILCAGGQRSVWYLPEVLCQRAINRFKGHLPSPNPKHSHQPTPHSQPSTHGRTSLLACPVKRQWAVSHDVVFRREKPCVVRRHARSLQAIGLLFLLQSVKTLLNIQ